MNTTTKLVTAALLASALLLPACGGSDASRSTAMAPTQIRVATPAGLLAMARVASETSDPLAVGTDAIAVADLNDDTSDPIAVS